MGVNRDRDELFAMLEDVFPTHVGVNRENAARIPAWWRFPHTRGGEPIASRSNRASLSVFPTHVGVNR